MHVMGYLDLGKLNDYIPMQYSGVVDIDGNELFEDDYVEVNFSGNKVIRRIIFHNGAFRFVKGKKQYNGREKILHPVLVYKNKIKKVGNLYEHKFEIK